MTQRVVNYTYGTGNPVLPNGSIDVRDGIDNLQSLDIFMNAPEDTYNQRDGEIVRTVSGMNNEFDAMIGGMNNEFDGQIISMGFTRIGTFASGATLTNPRQTLMWDIADGGDGQEYGWSGAFPKVVPASSTPASAGGISVGAWISRFDPELRIQVREALRRSYAEAGYNLVDGSFEAGGSLVNANDVLLHEASGKAFSGPAGSIAAGTDPVSGGFVDRSGELLRATLAVNSIFISAYKTPYATIHDALDAAMALSAATGVTVVSDVGFSITRPIEQPPKSKVIWTANCTISPSFSGAYIYQVDGGYAFPSYSNAHAWTLPGKTSMAGFKAYAENFEVGVNAEALVIRRAINTKVHDVVITGANLGGLRSQDGYEAEVQNINVVVSSARDVASIGCAINSSDGAFRSIVPIGYAKGGRVTGGSNYIENLHPWGNTETDAIGVMGKMHWGIEDVAGAEKNTFVSCYSDSPTRINTSADPSRVNGGVGWIVDSWYTTIVGGRHLGHSSNPDQTLIPIIISGQQCEISGFNDLRPSKSKQPVVVFEGTASPVNNNFTGGTVGRYLAGNFGYFTTQSNFLSSVSFKQNPRYGSVDLCFQITNSGVLIPGVSSDVLYVTLPSYINTNTIRGFASVPRLLYTFRKVFQSAGKTPVDVIAEIIPSTNRIQFVITYSDGTSSGYVTAAGMTAGDSGIFASFNIVGIANDNV